YPASAWSRDAALWSALCLATGILYVRSSRIGELDILLAPFVVIAVGGVLRSWHHHRVRRQAHLGAIVIATIAAIGAALTKGPAGLAVIALAGYGGIALWTAFTREPLQAFLVPRFTLPGGRRAPRLPEPAARPAGDSPAWLIWTLAIVLGGAAGLA